MAKMTLAKKIRSPMAVKPERNPIPKLNAKLLDDAGTKAFIDACNPLPKDHKDRPALRRRPSPFSYPSKEEDEDLSLLTKAEGKFGLFERYRSKLDQLCGDENYHLVQFLVGLSENERGKGISAVARAVVQTYDEHINERIADFIERSGFRLRLVPGITVRENIAPSSDEESTGVWVSRVRNYYVLEENQYSTGIPEKLGETTKALYQLIIAVTDLSLHESRIKLARESDNARVRILTFLNGAESGTWASSEVPQVLEPKFSPEVPKLKSGAT